MNAHLSTDTATGLTSQEAASRLKGYGPNVLPEEPRPSALKLFLLQCVSPLPLLLLIASGVSAAIGEPLEAILIGTIVIFMAGIGAAIEHTAGHAVEALKELSTSFVQVVRDGKTMKVATEDLVPGDIMLVMHGDRVGADGLIRTASELTVEESVLTGESIPVTKDAHPDGAEIEDMHRLYAGTFVGTGTATVEVTSTGAFTELGKIASRLSKAATPPTPLQRQLASLGIWLSVAAGATSVLILAVAAIRQQSLLEALIQSLSLAIAFVPEGITAVMTVVLAFGVREMVAKRTLMKRLVAAEGLGSVSVLATDKTGTVTAGRMTLERIWGSGGELSASDLKATKRGENLLAALRACSTSDNLTDRAALAFAETHGAKQSTGKPAKEYPFSSATKRAFSIFKDKDGFALNGKGAFEVVLPLCSTVIEADGSTAKLSGARSKEIAEQAEAYAGKGLRVLALFQGRLPAETDLDDRPAVERDFTFVALLVFGDPIRPEVPAAVAKLMNAGIRPVMITGDHPSAARAIAQQAGILPADYAGTVITGADLEAKIQGTSELSNEDILKCPVFARVLPHHKDFLIDLMHEAGEKVAMVGDGVNDAVAIRKSDIGIAAEGATDVTRNAADVVMLGGYDVLVDAVDLGRRIMIRTKLYLYYLLSGNACEVAACLVCLAIAKPLPFTSVQLLLINVLTDAAPAMALAFERGDANVMAHKPSRYATLLDREFMWGVTVQTVASTAFLLAVFLMLLPSGLAIAQTGVFTAYIFQKLLRGFTVRSMNESLAAYGPFTNRAMLASLAVSLGIWGIVAYGFPAPFGMERLPVDTVGWILLGSFALPFIEELQKLQRRRTLATA